MSFRLSLSRLAAVCLPTLLAACSSSGAPETLPAVGPLDAAARVRAEALIARMQCMACHVADANAQQFLQPEAAPDLARIGARKSADAMRRWILSPQSQKPGTAMPDLLGGLEPDQREATAGDLAQFLASLGGPLESARVEVDISTLERGRQLFHTVGCVACHTAQESAEDLDDPIWLFPAKEAFASISSPDLGALGSTTSVDALAHFLVDPLAARPSGRMPSLKLSHEEARAIAVYLLRAEARAGGLEPGLRSEYFEGKCESAASNFSKLTRVSGGTTLDLSQLPEHRENDFAVRWSGLLEVAKAGRYEFFTRSDDGSVLYVDGKLVVDNDGVHPAQERSGGLWLERGLHAFSVSMFEASGGEELSVTWQPPAGAQESLPSAVLKHWDVSFEAKSPARAVEASAVERGRRAFGELGCVACHPLVGMKSNSPRAPSFSALARHNQRGCLAPANSPAAPSFSLDTQQRANLSALVRDPATLLGPRAPAEVLAHKLERFACLNCHARDGVGGPDESTREHFRELVAVDLGNEGRLPPRLDGVGAKLYTKWMTRLLTEGTSERPYLATRMPLFGAANVADLAALFEEVDEHETPAPQAPISLDQAELGRRLAGTGGLGCIQCHVFNGVESLGIPAVDLTHVKERIKPAWVRQLLLDPKSLGMNTRMPIFWDKDGVSSARTILDGDPKKQVEAICNYLALGREMPMPPGLIAADAEYELVPETDTILCGVFLRGASARVLAVGSPQFVHYAFDLENSRLVCAWRGQFLNVKGTWDGRAGSLEWPTSADLFEFALAPALAYLNSADAAWPSAIGREAGFRRLGTRYDAARRPTFRYRLGDIEVEESNLPLAREGTALLVRKFELTSPHAVDGLYLRGDPRVSAAVPVIFSRTADGKYSAHAELEVAW